MANMKAILIGEGGKLSWDTCQKPEIGPGEVLLKIHAAALNRGDLMQRAGFYPPPKGASKIMGLEAAGEIAVIGEGVSGYKTGDRVAALMAGGGYGQYAVAHYGSLLEIPDDMSYETAAAWPEVLATVWTNVFDYGGLKKGETFLIHGGSSGIGMCAIQMASLKGANVFATAGSEDKCQACRDIGASAINYRQQDFEAIIGEAGGADVILDMVGGAYVQKNINSLKLKGRLINIAYQNGSQVEINLLPLMLKRLTVSGSTLRARSHEEKAHIISQVARDFWPEVCSGKMRTFIHKTFAMDEAEAAHALMESSRHIGKIILTLP